MKMEKDGMNKRLLRKPALPSGNQVQKSASVNKDPTARLLSKTHTSSSLQSEQPLHSTAQRAMLLPARIFCARLVSGSPCTDEFGLRAACREVRGSVSSRDFMEVVVIAVVCTRWHRDPQVMVES